MFDFLTKKFSSIFTRFTGSEKLTEATVKETLDKVRDALLEADVPYEVVEQFSIQIKQEVTGQKLLASLKPNEQLLKIVHDKLLYFLGGQASETSFVFQIPSVIMLIGLQGSGKTTTIAKLVHYVQDAAQKRGKTRRVLVGSVDFYRPAALDQLEIMATKAGASFYRSAFTNPVKAAQDIAKYGQDMGYDLVFLDTAGRLHVDSVMLDELKNIDNAVKPKYKLLVIDAMIGQESLQVANSFEKHIGFTGAILTKMDSEARGGVAFAFKYVLKKPILFAATGEKVQDLELFKPERMASRIIGMGDMMSLIEKAQSKIKHSDQEAMYKSLAQGKMTLHDFAQQIDMVNKLGSLSNIMKYLPGMGSLNISGDMIEKGEAEIKKFKAIIGSMTPKERIYTKILDSSRKHRIAKGAGVKVEDVNILLNRFEQSQQFMKNFKKMGNKFF